MREGRGWWGRHGTDYCTFPLEECEGFLLAHFNFGIPEKHINFKHILIK